MSCTNNSVIIQKQINGEVRQSASMSILRYNTCNRNINIHNEGIKHGSYERVLQKRRKCAMN